MLIKRSSTLLRSAGLVVVEKKSIGYTHAYLALPSWQHISQNIEARIASMATPIIMHSLAILLASHLPATSRYFPMSSNN